MTDGKLRVQCPLVYLGCNWRGVFDTLPDAQAAERAHWAKFHEPSEGGDDAEEPSGD